MASRYCFMNKGFLFFLLFSTTFSSNGQTVNTPVCSGQPSNATVYLKGYFPAQEISIKKDSLLNGFSLVITDSSYKIVGFRLLYEFEADPFAERDVYGSTVSRELLPWLPKMKGFSQGYFQVVCVAVEKNKIRYTASGFTILLVD